MTKSTATAKPTHGMGVEKTKDEPKSAAKQQFFVLALNMSWQLAIVILVPIVGGAELDKALKTNTTYTIIGLGMALVASTLVMWRMVRLANSLPVPKLTAAQKRAIQKQYEEEDEES